MTDDPTTEEGLDEITQQAKAIADVPPEIVPGSEDLPADVYDGNIDEDEEDALVDEED